jgi:hypothetical protein
MGEVELKQHDFDFLTRICRKCGLPLYGLIEIPSLRKCSNSRAPKDASNAE